LSPFGCPLDSRFRVATVSRVGSRAICASSRTRRLSPLRAADFCLVFCGLLVFAYALTFVTWSTGTEVAAAGGGPAVSASTTTAAQFRTHVDMVLVTVTVFEGRQLVRGLPRAAFRIFEDDVTRPIAYFASENVPLELLVAIDVSSSLRKAIGRVKADASYFVSALPPTSDVTLVSFNDEWHTLSEPPASAAARVQAIAPLAPYGMTSLYDALTHSFDVLGQQLTRRGVVVFTDGEDTASHTTVEAVEQRAETSDAVMYLIGHGQALTCTDLRDLCKRLANKSGGRAFFPKRPEQMREAFETILEELSSQYLLAYQPRQDHPDGKWHRIRVEVRDGHYDVRTRQGYRHGPPAPR
jgi:Ca-activated chloride channel homolog